MARRWEKTGSLFKLLLVWLLGPGFGLGQIDFREDLRLDERVDPDYFWFGPAVSVDVNRKGHIVICDVFQNRLIHLDAAGRKLRVLGGKGKGPGEFQNLYGFRFLPNQTAMAFEGVFGETFLYRYDTDLNFVDKRTAPENAPFGSYMAFSPDDKRFGALTGVSERGSEGLVFHRKSAIFDREFKELLVVSEHEGRLRYWDRGSRDWYVDYLAEGFKEGMADLGLFAFAPNGSVYTASTNAYRIVHYDAELRERHVVEKEVKRRLNKPIAVEYMLEEFVASNQNYFRKFIKPDMVADAIEQVGGVLPQPVIHGLIPLENGDLLAIVEYDLETKTPTADYISSDGRILGSVKLPPMGVSVVGGAYYYPPKILFKNGCAYVLEPNDDHEYALVRYRYDIQFSGKKLSDQ